jgi:hypothetical protein
MGPAKGGAQGGRIDKLGGHRVNLGKKYVLGARLTLEIENWATKLILSTLRRDVTLELVGFGLLGPVHWINREGWAKF